MEKYLKRTLVVLIYIGLISISTKVYAAQTAKIAKDNVRIREKASTDSNVVKLLSENEEVIVYEKENSWYKVEYKKNNITFTGYIREDMLSIENSNQEDNLNEEKEAEEEKKDQEIGESDAENINDKLEAKEETIIKTSAQLELKLLPTINSEVVSKIESGSEYDVKDVMNKWSYIESSDNCGWVLTSKLKSSSIAQKKEENSEQEKDNAAQENELQEAEQDTQNNTEEVKTKEEENKEESQKSNTTSEVKNETKFVNVDTLNVREKAESNAKVIDQLDINSKVTVLEKVDNTWSKIQSDKKIGYVASRFLSDNKVTVTSRSGETLRASQEVESNKDDDNTDTNTEQLGSQKNEAEQSNSEISKENTKSSTNNQETKSETSKSGSAVVEYAKQYLGYKYVLGKASPSEGFDCSGFTSYVFKHFGITLSRTSGAQASNGTKVEKSNLQLGDILIFNDSSNSRVGHVGIYIGENKFIHAANPSKGVIITSLSDSYYSARYVGARRVL